MDLKEKIDIILITYNRKELLGKTLEQIFAPESTIRDFEITVLNNASDDGTTELVNEYCTNYSNLKQIVNRRNIGGCGNIAKAFRIFPRGCRDKKGCLPPKARISLSSIRASGS